MGDRNAEEISWIRWIFSSAAYLIGSDVTACHSAERFWCRTGNCRKWFEVLIEIWKLFRLFWHSQSIQAPVPTHPFWFRSASFIISFLKVYFFRSYLLQSHTVTLYFPVISASDKVSSTSFITNLRSERFVIIFFCWIITNLQTRSPHYYPCQTLRK